MSTVHSRLAVDSTRDYIHGTCLHGWLSPEGVDRQLTLSPDPSCAGHLQSVRPHATSLSRASHIYKRRTLPQAAVECVAEDS